MGELKKIWVYTDGSGTRRGFPGGWAYAVVKDGRIVACGASGEHDTTNNRMELMAAIMGLSAASKVASEGYHVLLMTDSEYVLNQALKLHNTAANKDLVRALQYGMEKLLAGASHVKAHAGHPFNELVDKLAGIERKKLL